VTVGSAEEALCRGVVLAAGSVTWVDAPLGAGRRALAQVSAHGRPLVCALEEGARGDLVVRFDVPQRPVAPGQTVALYDAQRPDAVVGAGIVTAEVDAVAVA
jgi:tRNA-specific 2-thiouridylase